jgi:phosphoribosylformylglycinamidine synthase
MGEACRKFNTPVTGGNVSFYNQNPDGPVYPTPTIGMVGVVEDLSRKMTLDFKEAGDLIFLIGENTNDINSSQYLAKIHGVEFSPAPYFDLDKEFQLHELIMSLIENEYVESIHDISEGGLFTTLLEKSFNRILGFDVRSENSLRKDSFWFGEGQSRVVVTVAENDSKNLRKYLEQSNINYIQLGKVTDGEIKVNGSSWGSIEEWKELYDTAIEKHLARQLESEGALAMP